MTKTTLPLYKKLIEDLVELVDSGQYILGSLLPSENELCKAYHTTRPTVRQALSELTSMGYITRQQGKGSIVSAPKKALGILSVSGVTAGLGNQHLKTVILEKPVKKDWPEDFPHELTNDEKKVGCLFFTRLRYINNSPVLFEETFITNVHLPRFTARNLENKSLFKTLQDHYGIKVKEGEQKIWAISTNEAMSKLLHLEVKSPVLHLKRKLKTNFKDLNIYSWLYSNTEEYYLQDSF
ncbi:MAG: GntR family transcriptional regulator [Sphingobacteriaceae bacterium]